MKSASTTSSRRCDRRRGTAATELALALPLLMLLVLAASDFGRVFHAREVVSNAARIGASAGACRGFSPLTRASWESYVREAAAEEMQSLASYDEGDMTCEVEVTDAETSYPRTAVTIRYQFQTFVAWPGLPRTIGIQERVEIQRFR